MQYPVLVQRSRGLDAGVGVVVERIRHRVRIHVVVRRELRLDVRDRDEAADTNQHAVRDPRNEDLAIGHRQVVAIVRILVQKLIAPKSEGRGVAIVLAVDRRQSEAPVDVILLHGVGEPFDIQHRLVELHRIGVVVIGRRRVTATNRVGRQVSAGVNPAIDLDVIFVHPASDAGVAERVHQRAINRTRPRHAKAGGAAVRPLGERIRRNRLRCRRDLALRTARRRRLRIGGRDIMAPFEPVVVEEALQKGRAEIVIETRIVLVGIDRAPARRRHFGRHVRVGRLRSIEQAHRRERDTCQQSSLHRNRPNCCGAALPRALVPRLLTNDFCHRPLTKIDWGNRTN